MPKGVSKARWHVQLSSQVLAFAHDDLYLTKISSYTAHVRIVANDEQYIHQQTLMWHNNSKYNHGQLSRTRYQS